MASPSQSNVVSRKYNEEIQKVACQEGTKCQFHKFHTGNKIIMFNCQHSTKFHIRRELQGAIIDGTLKNMDLPALPPKFPKRKKKFVPNHQVPKSASVWEFVEKALINKKKILGSN